LNYTAENDDSDPFVAGRVKQSKRKRTFPKNFKSLLKSEEIGKIIAKSYAKETSLKKKGMFYVQYVFH